MDAEGRWTPSRIDRIQIRLAVIGIVIGLAGGTMLMAHPFAYPEVFSVETWRKVFWTAVAIGLIATTFLFFELSCLFRFSKIPLYTWLGIVALVTLMFLFGEKSWWLRAVIGAIAGAALMTIVPLAYSFAQGKSKEERNAKTDLIVKTDENVTPPPPSKPIDAPTHAVVSLMEPVTGQTVPRTGSVGIRIEGGSNIRAEGNYFGRGVGTAVDAKNTTNLVLSGNVHEPQGPAPGIPERNTQFLSTTNLSLQNIVLKLSNEMKTFEADWSARDAKNSEDGWTNFRSASPQDESIKWQEFTNASILESRRKTQEYRVMFSERVSIYYSELRARFSPSISLAGSPRALEAAGLGA